MARLDKERNPKCFLVNSLFPPCLAITSLFFVLVENPLCPAGFLVLLAECDWHWGDNLFGGEVINCLLANAAEAKNSI